MKPLRLLLNLLVFVFIFLIFSRCGKNDDVIPAADADDTVFISGFSFIPQNLSAPAGAKIFFYNDDDFSHQILSQSGPDAFDATGVFDSMVIDPGEAGFILIPESAVSGEVFYYYDASLEDALTTPNGSITVE